MFEKCATRLLFYVAMLKTCQLFSKLSRGIFQCEEPAVRETVKVGQLVWRRLTQMTFCLEICVVEVADAASKSDGVWTHFSSIRHKLMISPFD